MRLFLFAVIVSLTGCDSGIIVNRIIPAEPHVIESGGSIKFWREVCTVSDTVIDVHRVFIDVDNDKSYMVPSVTYGFNKDGCDAILYNVPVPNLPSGKYVYQPTLNTGGALYGISIQKLPSETIYIK